MGTYADTGDVLARLPGRTIDATTDPDLTRVGEWIDGGEAMLHGALQSGGATIPITNANGILIMKAWSTDYAEGRTRIAFASTGGDGDNDDGKDLITAFNQLLTEIREDVAGFEAMLSGGAATDATRQLKAYTTDNDDSKTISGGDFTPEFTRDSDDQSSLF